MAQRSARINRPLPRLEARLEPSIAGGAVDRLENAVACHFRHHAASLAGHDEVLLTRAMSVVAGEVGILAFQPMHDANVDQGVDRAIN